MLLARQGIVFTDPEGKNIASTESAAYFPDFIIASPKLEFQPIIGFDEV